MYGLSYQAHGLPTAFQPTCLRGAAARLGVDRHVSQSTDTCAMIYQTQDLATASQPTRLRTPSEEANRRQPVGASRSEVNRLTD